MVLLPLSRLIFTTRILKQIGLLLDEILNFFRPFLMVFLNDLRLLLLVENLGSLGSFSQFLHNLIVINDYGTVIDSLAFDW